MPIIVHGPNISTYVRSVRMALIEKNAPYDLAEVDILAGQHRQPDHLARHPFGKVPALTHDGFTLYETIAILRYLDHVLPGPSLIPSDAKAAARADMIAAIVDSYAYGAMITAVVMNRLVAPMLGGQPDEAAITAALPIAETSLAAIAKLAAAGGGPFLAGSALSIADLMLAPIFGYFSQTPEGAAALAKQPGLAAWWTMLAARPAMAATAPKFG
jgi:glutathione S-transferase